MMLLIRMDLVRMIHNARQSRVVSDFFHNPYGRFVHRSYAKHVDATFSGRHINNQSHERTRPRFGRVADYE
ncbi:MAG: hypothetical protein JWM11_6005 [Planctomycetaceae bacterium]|nr:hypothetical protein [Planctomycetaceae bacterium]